VDTTIEVALKIISNPSIADWRKKYWINMVEDEISGLRAVGLGHQADLLEKQLTATILTCNVYQTGGVLS
jgi:hypothetical protein